jgi:hypothetical protein
MGATSWTNPNGGDFYTSTNWSNGTPTDSCTVSVTLPGTYTVTVPNRGGNAPASANQLQLGATGANPGVQTIAIVGSAAGDAGLSADGGTVGPNGRIVLDSTSATADAGLDPKSGLTNSGTIETLPGSGGTRSLFRAIDNTGTIAIGADTTGAYQNNANLHLTNEGTLTVASGKTFTLGGQFTQTAAGTTAVSGALTAPGGSFVTGGTFTGNPPALEDLTTLSASAGSGTFRVHGRGGTDSNVGPNITAIVEADGADASFGGPGVPWTNAGTIELTGTDHNASIDTKGGLTNTGTIETLPGSGGTRTLYRGLNNSGTMTIGADTDGAYNNAASLQLTNTGTLTVASGRTFTLGIGFAQSGGALVVDGTLSSNPAIPISGGTLEGTGTVVAPSGVSNTGGIVHPGHSPGTLSITGDYTQGSGGALAVDVAGTDPGTGYSQLAVSGNATVAGALNVTTLTPQTGSFRILSAKALTGKFAPVNFTGQTYGVTYAATGATLTTGGTADTTAPKITGFGANPTSFAIDPKGEKETAASAKAKKAHRGTDFKYTLTERARVVFTIDARTTGRKSGKKCVKATKKNRKKKHCTRYARSARFAVASKAGSNRHHFTGRIGSRKLKPGLYRTTAVATDAAGNHSKPAQLTIKVVRR